MSIMTIDPELRDYWQPINVIQNSDATLDFVLLQPNSFLPYDLTGCTVTVTVKASRYVDDSTGTSYSATIVNELGGGATVTLPAADLAVAGSTWYNVKISSGAINVKPMFGPFNIIAT